MSCVRARLKTKHNQRVFSFRALHVNAVSEPRGIVIPKRNRKEIPKVLPSANMRNHISTFKASNTSQSLTRHSQNQSTLRHTKRNGHIPTRLKEHNNTKPIWKTIVLCNALCFKLKYKKPAKNSPSLIVIPSKTAKNFPIYYLQPTWKIRFQHSKIEEQVQHAPPKEHIKEHITTHTNGQNTRATPKPSGTPKKPKPDARA